MPLLFQILINFYNSTTSLIFSNVFYDHDHHTNILQNCQKIIFSTIHREEMAYPIKRKN